MKIHITDGKILDNVKTIAFGSTVIIVTFNDDRGTRAYSFEKVSRIEN